jgi:hypothetical protein
MRLFRAGCLVAVLFITGSIALAQGSDPIGVPTRGPTGSPPCSGSLTLGNGTDDCTVAAGQDATSVTIVFPSADFTNGETVTCGISNAFLDGGPTELVNGVLGFAPTITGSGASATAACTWTVFTGTNNDPPGENESVAQMETECYLTNLTNSLPPSLRYNDPDDCAGVPGGTTNSDLVYSITGAVTGPGDDIVALTTGVPEPSSASLLLLGLVGLGFFARRKLLA